MMKVDEFIKQLEKAASCNTLYVMGCFGSPMTPSNKTRAKNEHPYNKRPERAKMIDAAAADCFGFDCVNLIKGILWGWNGDTSRSYGGAVYKSNNVPDLGADSFFRLCHIRYTDFSNIQPGAAVWMPGHIGIYVGGGKVIECSPRWKNCVQYTNLGNIGNKTGNWREWKEWGFIPFVDYPNDRTGYPDKNGLYNSVDECPGWTHEAVQWFIDEHIIQGTNNSGALGLDSKTLRILVIIYRTLKNRGLIK